MVIAGRPRWKRGWIGTVELIGKARNIWTRMRTSMVFLDEVA